MFPFYFNVNLISVQFHTVSNNYFHYRRIVQKCGNIINQFQKNEWGYEAKVYDWHFTGQHLESIEFIRH